MYNNQSHPLLAQVPLTVSPFVSLPTATTLPYTYKSLPSTLPPTSTGPDASGEHAKSKYIISSSGAAAHPDDIIASCRALQSHLEKLSADAAEQVAKWEKNIEERELAEKRRLAPGWLDSNARILEPQRVPNAASKAREVSNASLLDAQEGSTDARASTMDDAAGRELDRAFGGMSVSKG